MTPCASLQVKVKRRGDDQKFLARVLALGVDCDMALMTVEDGAFWEGVEPLEFGPLPRLQDTVAVVGYPIGGDTISVTVGVVSRIEVGAWWDAEHMCRLSHASKLFLACLSGRCCDVSLHAIDSQYSYSDYWHKQL